MFLRKSFQRPVATFLLGTILSVVVGCDSPASAPVSPHKGGGPIPDVPGLEDAKPAKSKAGAKP